MVRRHGLWLWPLAIVCLTPLSTWAGAPELVAGWDAAACRVELQADRQDGVLFLRARCPLSEDEAHRALAEMLPKLRAMGDAPARYRSLFLGRLVDYPWLSEGLARGAVQSGRWDTAKGRPVAEKNVNRFVANVLLDGPGLRLLAEALGTQGLRVTNVSAEKVLILRASELPFGEKLKTEGISGRARVPFDAMVHLILKTSEGSR